MEQFIRHAYAIQEANEFFNKIDKESILKLYDKLDYVYDLLESLDVVSIYTKFQLLKEFEITSGIYDTKYLNVGDRSVEIDVNKISHEIYAIYTK